MHRVRSTIGSEFIKKTKWHFFHIRKRTPFFHQILASAFTIRDAQHPFDSRVRYFGVFHDHIVCGKEDFEKVGSRMTKYCETHRGFMLSLMKKTVALHKIKETEWKKIGEKLYSNYSAIQLADALSSYVASLLEFRLSLPHPLFMETYIENEIQKGLFRHFGAMSGELYSLAVTPTSIGRILKEEVAFLSIASRASRTRRAVQRHAAEFGTMANVRFDGTFYDEAYYVKRLSKLKPVEARRRLSDLRSSHRHHVRSFQKILHNVKKQGDARLALLIETVNFAVFFRSFRTEIFYGSMKYYMRLFDEVAGRIGVPSSQDVFYCYWDEVDNALRSGSLIDRRVIAKRKKGYSFLSLLNGTYVAWDGSDARIMYDAFEASRKTKGLQTKEIMGVAAYPGVAHGRAVIVRNFSDLKRLRTGDVLITHATNMNMIPFLKIATAIVTEEGGILSHAAIISRELKVPCVIGTRNATKVFKTGDTIEVDAEKGIVTKS